MDIERIKEILYDIRNEFENDIDSIPEEINEEQINFGFEFLDSYINKVEMILDDEQIDIKE